MKTVKFKELKENVKVGDVIILNTSNDPKEYICKNNAWHVVSVEPELIYREYRKRTRFVYKPNYEPTFTVLDENEYKTLPLNAKIKCYTTEQIDEAKDIVRKKVLEIFRNMPWKQANLISYIFYPKYTTVGDKWSYNEQLIDNTIFDNIMCKDLEYDGNAGFDLLSIAKSIKDGWFDN